MKGSHNVNRREDHEKAAFPNDYSPKLAYTGRSSSHKAQDPGARTHPRPTLGMERERREESQTRGENERCREKKT